MFAQWCCLPCVCVAALASNVARMTVKVGPTSWRLRFYFSPQNHRHTTYCTTHTAPLQQPVNPKSLVLCVALVHGDNWSDVLAHTPRWPMGGECVGVAWINSPTWTFGAFWGVLYGAPICGVVFPFGSCGSLLLKVFVCVGVFVWIWQC
jgi:hypothetical protein